MLDDDKIILLVDDDKASASLCETALRCFSTFKTHYARTGEEALELIEQREYAGLICDVRLPRIPGSTVVLRARALYQFLPIAFYTAHVTTSVRDTARECSAQIWQKRICEPRCFANCVVTLVDRWRSWVESQPPGGKYPRLNLYNKTFHRRRIIEQPIPCELAFTDSDLLSVENFEGVEQGTAHVGGNTAAR